jgi:hypothetical protein
MCFAVACQAFCFLGITCKNTSVRILEIVFLPNKETLDKYKEKLIDYEFSYDPRPFESLEILQDKLTAFKDYPLQKYLTTLQFFCSFSSDISPKTSFNSIDDDSLSKSSKHTIISLKSCLSGKVIPMPIYGIVISL